MLLRLAVGWLPVLWLFSSTSSLDATEPKARKTSALAETVDIQYFPGAGDRHQLDVIAPAEKKGLPVLMLVHGGSWIFGDKNFQGKYRNVGRTLAESGLIVVLPNYRLSPWVRHPEHVKDIARAFAWTRRNIQALGGDPNRIYLCGHSAGGHLVTLLATDPSVLADSSLELRAADRKALRGVIGVSGVYSIPGPKQVANMLDQMLEAQQGTEPLASTQATLIRKTGQALNPFKLVFGEDMAHCRQASPLTHVRPGLPPFLLLYAEQELPLLADMAEEFAVALRREKVPTEVRKLAERNHNNILFRATNPSDPVAQAIVDFVNHSPRARK